MILANILTAALSPEQPVGYLFYQEEEELVLRHCIAVMILLLGVEGRKLLLLGLVRSRGVLWSGVLNHSKDRLRVGA